MRFFLYARKRETCTFTKCDRVVLDGTHRAGAQGKAPTSAAKQPQAEGLSAAWPSHIKEKDPALRCVSVTVPSSDWRGTFVAVSLSPPLSLSRAHSRSRFRSQSRSRSRSRSRFLARARALSLVCERISVRLCATECTCMSTCTPFPDASTPHTAGGAKFWSGSWRAKRKNAKAAMPPPWYLPPSGAQRCVSVTCLLHVCVPCLCPTCVAGLHVGGGA